MKKQSSQLTPVEFQGFNVTLGPPEGVSENDCSKLPVCIDNGVCTSVWTLTPKQRKMIADGYDIQLSIWSGNTQPPVMVSAYKRIMN